MNDTVYVFRNKKTGEFSHGNSHHLHCTTKNIVDARIWPTLKSVKRACNSYKNEQNRLIKYYEDSSQKLRSKQSSSPTSPSNLWAQSEKNWYDNLIKSFSGAKQRLDDFYNSFEVIPVKLELQESLIIEEAIKTKEKLKPKKISKEEDIIDGV